jgi:anti-sigma-K factor RskA
MNPLSHEQVESIAALQAIGAATPEEEQSIQEHLATCFDCRKARDEFAEAASLLSLALPPVVPPEETRAAILSSVAAEPEAVAELRDRTWRRLQPAGFNPWWLATAATLFLALWGWREFGIRVARERLQSQEAEIRRLSEENARLNQRAKQLSKEVSTLAATETRTIDLAGQPASPAASARAFVQTDEGRAVVFFYDLPANPNDKSYQLWILRGSETQPESAGVFDIAQSGRASLVVDRITRPEDIKGMAVTLEPRGGVPQPTSNTFYVAGQV